MDIVAFRTVNSNIEDYKVVDIFVNNNRLIDILHQFELPLAYQEGAPEMAGAYEGLPPLLVLPPANHFWGEASEAYSYPGHKVSLLEYAYSGVPGEWPFVAKIEVGKRVVRWSDFEQVRRLKLKNGYQWKYNMLGEFCFDRDQYDMALKDASANAYT
jgi:hypothetical protein